jgi:O-antigen/teichoic acid export membrane protein
MSLAEGRVAQATAWRFGYLIVQGGASLLLFAALAHILGPADFAIAALAQAVLVLAQAVGDFGLSQAAVSALPVQFARHPQHRASLEAGAARSFLWAAGLALVLVGVACLFVPADARSSVACIAPAAAAAVVVSGADGLLRATGDFRRPLELTAMSRAGSFAALAVALLTHDALFTCVALSAGTVVASLPAATFLRSKHSGRDLKRYGDLLAVSVPLGIAQVFIVAGGRLNTVVLGSYLSLAAAAAFESTWRLYQLSLYVAGGLATSIAPFIGDAFGSTDAARLRKLLVGRAVLLAVTGSAGAVVLLVVRAPLCDLLFDEFGDTVSAALVPLALVIPLGFVGFLALTTLAAVPGTRGVILSSHGAGAATGLALVLLLARDHGVRGAAAGCAIGVAVTQIVMIGRLVLFIRGLRRPGAAGAPDVRITTA